MCIRDSPSTVPGRTLHGFRCVPEGQVRAVLQLSHGMVEYICLLYTSVLFSASYGVANALEQGRIDRCV